MRRTIAVLCILLVLAAPVAAQGELPNRSDGEDPGPPAEKQPSLPEQASNTATRVLDAVFGFTAEVFSSIGQALQSLLGGGEQRVSPEQGQDESGSGSGG